MSKHAKRTESLDKDERGTPDSLFDKLHAIHNFTVDVASTHENAKLPRHYTKEDDGLSHSWAGERVWCNPPYSNPGPWLLKAVQDRPDTAVFLLPASTDTGWFHDLVLPYFNIEFVRGRIKFVGYTVGAPFGCMILTLKDNPNE